MPYEAPGIQNSICVQEKNIWWLGCPKKRHVGQVPDCWHIFFYPVDPFKKPVVFCGGFSSWLHTTLATNDSISFYRLGKLMGSWAAILLPIGSSLTLVHYVRYHQHKLNLFVGGIPGPLTVEFVKLYRGPFIKMNSFYDFTGIVGGGIPPNLFGLKPHI